MDRSIASESRAFQSASRHPFGIGIEHVKSQVNIGTLLRSAVNFGASFVFTVGRRYKRQASDTVYAPGRIPVWHFADWQAYRASCPFDWIPVGVEIRPDATSLETYRHPVRCVYLLGPEDGSLGREARGMCKSLIRIPSQGCLNVAVAGAIVMYSRITQMDLLDAPAEKANDDNV